MQPYYLPYIGYWQLINSVDLFVFLDDVQFKPRSWMCRNRVFNRTKGKYEWLTIPVSGGSQNKSLSEIRVMGTEWLEVHKRKLSDSLKGENFSGEAISLYQGAIRVERGREGLCNMLMESIELIARELGLSVEFAKASTVRRTERSVGAQNQILDLCRDIGAQEYINLPGGVGLYEDEAFRDAGVKLSFLRVSEFKSLRSCLATSKFEEKVPVSIIEDIGCNSIKVVMKAMKERHATLMQKGGAVKEEVMVFGSGKIQE